MIEDRDYVNDIAAWTELFGHVLYCVLIDIRGEVLARATKNDEATRREREKGPYGKSPHRLRSRAVTKLKAYVVQAFIRDLHDENGELDMVNLLCTPSPLLQNLPRS